MRRRVIFAAIAGASLLASGADALAEQYAGRIIVDVRVEVAGQPTTDASIVEMVETRVGEPFSMLAVRSTVDHLVGVGRFEDVRVEATPSTQGVGLRWLLTPIRRIALVSLNGGGLSETTVRSELTERYGLLPSASRVGDMVNTIRTLYADHGYRSAVVNPRLVERDSPERLELVLDATAGVRTRIGTTNVKGDAGESTAALLRRLDLTTGQPFDGPALTARRTSSPPTAVRSMWRSRSIAAPAYGSSSPAIPRPRPSAKRWRRSRESGRWTWICSRMSVAASKRRFAARAIARRKRSSRASRRATRSSSLLPSRVARCIASPASMPAD
jgi:outer membrane protein assembly factor BamA